jgi:hypothetical protein
MLVVPNLAGELDMIDSARSPSELRWFRTRGLAALVVITLAGGPAAPAQPSELGEKLESLRVRHATDHYALAGTVSDARLAEYGRALEYIHREYAVGFAKLFQEDRTSKRGRRQGQRGTRSKQRDERDQRESSGGSEQETPAKGILDEDEQARFAVIIFAKEREYHKFGREFLAGGTEHSGGMYLPGLKVLLILDRPDAEETYGVLFHEAFHQFMHRHVKNPPMWLNEGLAVYYECARPTRGGLRFSAPRKSYWQIARKVIPKPEAVPLWQVVTADRAAFYDPTPIVVRGFAPHRRPRLCRRAATHALLRGGVHAHAPAPIRPDRARARAELCSRPGKGRRHTHAPDH